jgi:hypothetical protein
VDGCYIAAAQAWFLCMGNIDRSVATRSNASDMSFDPPTDE